MSQHLAGVEIVGAATPEEIAAILAALRRRERAGGAPHSRYEQWRRERQRVLRDNR